MFDTIPIQNRLIYDTYKIEIGPFFMEPTWVKRLTWLAKRGVEAIWKAVIG